MAERRLPVGAEVGPGGVDFRVWAPRRGRVDVVFDDPRDGAPLPLRRAADGYFSGVARLAHVGSRYRFRLDGEGKGYPDPASRFQPEGPHGPSEVVDPRSFPWTDTSFPGRSLEGQVLYELHVGTFTPEGTWASATRELATIADLGVTVVEVMPIADFPGKFGWGYDGVNLFAPTRLYGRPDDVRRFVDEAHRLGLAVILDVVYNHLGPDGNYLAQFSDSYFGTRHTDWGPALDFDGEGSAPVRELFVANARYWVEEFHVDGLRLDATQCIHDTSPEHVLTSVANAVRAAARGRATIVVAENEPQETALVRPVERGGRGLDGVWNDDLHHSAFVALTGRTEGYYTDFRGTPQELVSAAKRGFLFQGQHHAYGRKRRGAPAFDVEPHRFVTFLANHDHVASNLRGERLSAIVHAGDLRALTAYLLLGPGTPMLFQGQEYGASTPFTFFADHESRLADLVRTGRKGFMAQFESHADPIAQEHVPDPGDPATFARCKLDPNERARHPAILAMHRDLLALRRTDDVVSGRARSSIDGAVLGARAFVLRHFGDDGDDRILLVNLGSAQRFAPAPEPLLAPPEHAGWALLWSSEDPRYGGAGSPSAIESDAGWLLPAHAAVLLAAERRAPATTAIPAKTAPRAPRKG